MKYKFHKLDTNYNYYFIADNSFSSYIKQHVNIWPKHRTVKASVIQLN